MKTEWLTSKEAQKETGYKRTRLYELRKEGKVIFKQSNSGRKILYEKNSLENLFEK